MPPSPRYQLWHYFLWLVVISMLLQISWQIPEMLAAPLGLVAGGMLLVLGMLAGSIGSVEANTQQAIRVLALLLFIFLSFQWSTSFRDDHLIWSFRWMCVGLFSGTLLPRRAAPGGGEEESGDAQASEE